MKSTKIRKKLLFLILAKMREKEKNTRENQHKC